MTFNEDYEVNSSVNFYFHNTILSQNSTLFHIIFITPWYVDLFHCHFNVTYLVVLELKSPHGEC